MTTSPAPCEVSSRAAPARQRSPSILTTDVSLEGAAGLEFYRDAIVETSDISPLQSADRFYARARIHHLGSAVLTDVRTSSVSYNRSARHVARAAYDHYQIAVSLTADIRYLSGRKSQAQRPGDIVILDSARSHVAYVNAPSRGAACVPAVFIPRAALTALLPSAIGDEQFIALKRELPQTRLLADHVTQMLQTVDADPRAQLGAAVEDLTGVLARTFSGRRDIAPLAQEGMRRAALDSLKRIVERRLGSSALSVDLICARSGWSRATVYRLFEPEGGLARYIRQRRLHRAFRELMRGPAPGRRILDLAMDCQFASEATFGRAFQQMFGISPGAVRELAAPSRDGAAAGRRPRNAPGASDADTDTGTDTGTNAIRWIKLLSAG